MNRKTPWGPLPVEVAGQGSASHRSGVRGSVDNSGVLLQKVDPYRRSELDRFIAVPWYIHRKYAPNSHWVPPIRSQQRKFLRPDRNPFFEHATAQFWIATVGGHDVGRIAAVRDELWLAKQDANTGSFGLFESTNDPAVAKRLLDAAAGWLHSQGLNRMIGPLDLSTNHTTGLLVDAFERDPFVLMPYNPQYYEQLLVGAGLDRERDLWQWAIEPAETPPPAHIVAAAHAVSETYGLTLKRMPPKAWAKELGKVSGLYNDIWSENWGFIPLTAAETANLGKELSTVTESEFSLMAEQDGEPIGFCLSITNINPVLRTMNGRMLPLGLFRYLWSVKVARNLRGGRLLLLGVRKEHRGQGVDALLVLETSKAASRRGCGYCELGWVSEDNHAMNTIIGVGGGTRVKTYRVFAGQTQR